MDGRFNLVWENGVIGGKAILVADEYGLFEFKGGDLVYVDPETREYRIFINAVE